MQNIRKALGRLAAILGFEASTTSHREKLAATAGAMLGITAVVLVSHWSLGPAAANLMIASMGASAVLLFAVPHGALSQPWAAVAGHLLSAAVGVSCQKLFAGHPLAPALAVGLAVGVMCYARCIHPPGGATALTAVIGGDSVHALGYSFILVPVLLNLAAILSTALVFNNFFPWRRYPASLMSSKKELMDEKATGGSGLTHEDLAAAMESMDTYVDITSEELAELFDRAWAHARDGNAGAVRIEGGRFYSNGHPGARWSVRQIIDLPAEPLSSMTKIIYKNVAGRDLHETGICRFDEFNGWARFEVAKKGDRWIKMMPDVPGGSTAKQAIRRKQHA
ncbi:hypothetical protein F6455_04715 [Proteobacteria bacterium 005FR1]|nr:hypothetical protein [Proteobacteria bacterium 005FR1]